MAKAKAKGKRGAFFERSKGLAKRLARRGVGERISLLWYRANQEILSRPNSPTSPTGRARAEEDKPFEKNKRGKGIDRERKKNSNSKRAPTSQTELNPNLVLLPFGARGNRCTLCSSLYLINLDNIIIFYK